VNFEKLDTASADPRPRWKLVAEQTVALRLRHVPEEAAAAIVSLRLPVLDARLAAVYETWGSTEAEAETALADFDTALMKDARLLHERARQLAGDGNAELDAALSRFRYDGHEINGLRGLLRPGERVQALAWTKATTNQRQAITRQEMRDAARPTTWSNDGTWARQFIPIDQLAQMESEESAAAERAAAPLQYGKNLDFPDGVSPRVGR
jgi:hypothetical protein